MKFEPLAPEILERVRRIPPNGHGIVDGSLPVISFGDPGVASVATLSLNPSDKEFLTKGGKWIDDSARRLESLNSLGVPHPSLLRDDQVSKVLHTCRNYFYSSKAYLGWFRHLEAILKECGAGSNFDGTACHLDLVQWATEVGYKHLPKDKWNYLVTRDCEFLEWQLKNGSVDIVLVNGRATMDGLLGSGIIQTERIIPDERFTIGNRSTTLRRYYAFWESCGILFLGWNFDAPHGIPRIVRPALVEWLSCEIQAHKKRKSP